MIIPTTGAALFLAKHLIVPAKYVTASYCEARLALDAAKAPSASPDEPQPERLTLTTMEYLGRTAGTLTRSKIYYTAFVTQSEPFVIQATLNEVVRKGFQTDAGYLMGQILSGLPLGASLFGIDSSSVTTFNSRAQPVLFPDVGFGMANNPWAQAYAAGGLLMVAAFALGYAAILSGLTLLFRKTEGVLKAGVAVIGVWVGFYFHRNDLFIEVIYLKHVVYIFALALLIALVINQTIGWRAALPFKSRSHPATL
jgi:hypothetical protein